LNFSANIESLKPSATLALAARAHQLKSEGRSVVDLSAGEPAFRTPDYAAQAGIDAIRAGHTGYPPTPGIPELRQAVAEYLSDTTAHSTAESSLVMVSAGVKQALFNCVYCLFGQGDEVLVPAPYWPTYPTLVELAGARPVVVETTWDEHFRLDVDRLERARTPQTRGLFLNSPGNPTGAVYDLDAMRDILAWCDRHGVWVLSDEIYRLIAFEGGAASSVYDVADRGERVVLFDGVSKAFCMPGWRIGFAVGPQKLIKKATDLQSQTTSGAVNPSQHAAAAALGSRSQRDTSVDSLVARLDGLRRIGMELLGGIDDLEVRDPPGAIYFYGRLTGSEPSLDVAERLLIDGGVASIPGEPFGSPGFLRFNFAVTEEELEEGLRRVAAHFQGGNR
jgi:aspartate/methionine/tyrosine aminotransferase